MEYIGKALATLFLMVPVILIGVLGIVIIVGPFIAYDMLNDGMKAIWSK